MPRIDLPLVGKTCTNCLVFKDASLFSKHHQGTGGLQWWCKECQKGWASRNHDKVLAKGRKFDANNRKLRAERQRARRNSNPAEARRRAAEYIAKNKEKFAKIFRHHAALRRARIKGQAIANTYSKETYAIYKSAPEGCDVDHIIPLAGKDVCGLHVPWNLQYLPTLENRKKGNRYAAN